MKSRRTTAIVAIGASAILGVTGILAIAGGEPEKQAAEVYAASPLSLDEDFVNRNTARIDTLFSQLDLSRPGLEGCATLYRNGELKRAAEALLDYFAKQERRLPVDPLDKHAEGKIVRRADDALKGVFTEQNITAAQKRRPDGGLDWEDKGPNGDKEWAWFLNRHFFLRDLAETYLTTGNKEYEKQISTFIEDWITANPYPERLNFTAQWRPLEAARRITDAWSVIFFSPDIQLTPEARLLMLCSLPDHADDLANHGSFWGGNHLLTEQSSLALIAMAWPEFKDAERWLDRAEAVTNREIMVQTYPDGAYKELTNHYQHIVVDSLERMLAILHAAGRHNPELEARAEKMWDYYAEVMRPNGDGPLNSASDVEYNRNNVRDAAKVHRREDWAYIASAGETGMMPDIPPSRFFPFAGHALMRSGWKKDSQWAFFDIGPHGTAHQHNDRLHFDLSLGVDDILIDCGRYTYQPGPWRDYFSGPAAHNIILVNGKGPVPPPLSVTEPLPVTAIITDDYDFFAATNDYAADPMTGQGGAKHTRSFFYKRGSYWIVTDCVQAYGENTVESLWHFHPTVEVTRLADGEIRAAAEHSALRIRTLAAPEQNWRMVRGEENPIQGWFSREYNARRPASAGIAQSTIRSPQVFIRLLYPEGMEAPLAEVQQKGSRVTLTIRTSHATDRLSFDTASGTHPDIAIQPR
jgi:hypothetical protein